MRKENVEGNKVVENFSNHGSIWWNGGPKESTREMFTQFALNMLVPDLVEMSLFTTIAQI